MHFLFNFKLLCCFCSFFFVLFLCINYLIIELYFQLKFHNNSLQIFTESTMKPCLVNSNNTNINSSSNNSSKASGDNLHDSDEENNNNTLSVNLNLNDDNNNDTTSNEKQNLTENSTSVSSPKNSKLQPPSTRSKILLPPSNKPFISDITQAKSLTRVKSSKDNKITLIVDDTPFILDSDYFSTYPNTYLGR